MSLPPTVLLVDDEVLTLRPLARILRYEGFQTDWADRGDTALEKLRARDFDFLLLDLLMPGMTGLDVLRALRSFEHRPVVVVCSGSGDESLEAACRLGADAVLPKPVNLEHLLTLLRSKSRTPASTAAGFAPLSRTPSMR